MIRARILLLLLGILGVGCWSDPSDQNGVADPFRVRYPDPNNSKATLNAQYVPGTLPGLAPETHTPDAGGSQPPQITAKSSTANIFLAGQAGTKSTGLSGEASSNTSSIGVALDGVGNGYWILGVSGVNPATGDLTWTAILDFGEDIPSGNHKVLAVPIDAHGVAGKQVSLPVCVLGHVTDNFQECVATQDPPKAVISLSWDTNVDLDLQVVTPDGTLVDSKHPYSSATLTDAAVPSQRTVPVSAGRIDRDSNAGCVLDGVRTENLIWDTVKPHGVYGIYANLFSACGQAAVRFEVSVYTAVPNPDGGTPYLKKWTTQAGELLGFQANAGAQRGLFVTEFDF